MSCLGRIVMPAVFCLAIAGSPELCAADEFDKQQNSWYFLGASTDRFGNEEQNQPGFASEPERRSLDDSRSGERYKFSLRYTDLGEPTGQVGLGRGPDPYGTGDVLSIYLDHSFDLGEDWLLRPHVVAGLGLAYGNGLDRHDEMSPAFELGFGATYEISDSWDFFTEYRAFYTRTAQPNLRPEGDDSGFAQNFTLGARLRF
ncbi:hypothetical protein [Nisaea sp.]|uniref:outer membrane protein n=1 Tax=Nisaea sp. TaxID=2024842 RepID=UPI0032635FAE